MIPLDEQALRRPTWRGDVPVTLADGQVWRLAKPRVRFFPRRDAGGEFKVAVRLVDADYMAKIERYFTTSADDSDVDAFLAAQFDLWAAVLLLNYDLDDEAVGRLLSFGFDPADEAEAETRRILTEVAQGQGPKASPAGSEPDS